MPATPAIEVPVTIDLRPAADALEDLAGALEITGAFLRGKATDLRKAAPSEAYRALGEQLLEDARRAAEDLDESLEEARDVIASDTPERFETDEEARAAGADPAEIGDTHRIEITD